MDWLMLQLVALCLGLWIVPKLATRFYAYVVKNLDG